ncbi:hypothetical protein DF3PA_100030 [Candidatus Defluviicoccus seviourii]|uniref:Uncharacterized protein n=1 Tax=Candidatus Defluviicoccus seviourii TaxID=2565273 RepID=A0A564W9Q0_9PROT|nr:hypothetical protein DF3PA_100030 [Candidatus Defluviicoccus seviourii]
MWLLYVAFVCGFAHLRITADRHPPLDRQAVRPDDRGRLAADDAIRSAP